MSQLAKQRIAQAKAENWKHLDLGNCDLTDLEAEVPELFELTHLEELELSSNEITDISPLLRFGNLTVLDLWNNKITDLSPLSELVNLTSLDLGSNDITDLSPLSGLVILTQLNLYGNQITDLSPLSKLGNLMQLKLGYNQITDLSPLSGMVNLTHLDLYTNQITDISPLSGMVNLTLLYLRQNQITDLSPLSGLGNLTDLNLETNKITDLSPLSGLVNLTDLHLDDNQITDLSPLSGLGNLTLLDLRVNQITNLSPLSGLGNLTSLNLYRNQITDLSPLSGLVNLTHLYLDGNKITDLSPLSGLVNLNRLELGSNKITDLSPLSGLGNLTSLDLDCNQITDLSPLSGLVNLTLLKLNYNQITDLTPLLPLLQHKKKFMLGYDEMFHPKEGEIDVRNNPLQTPPMEIVEQGTVAVLRYFEELRSKEVVPNDEIKMILIGNSTAGKSSLSLFLREGKYKDNQETTHGIALTDVWKIPQSVTTAEQFYNIKLWDFGGQEYYHATHRLFLSKDAIYVLLWETDTNKNGTLPTLVYYPDESEPSEVMLDHYHYAYWLKTIRYYAKPETTIFLVQNKTDLNKQEAVNSKEHNLPPQHIKAISIKKAFEQSQKKIESEETWLESFNVFKKELIQQLRKEVSNHKLLRYWLRVRDAVIEQAKKTNTMPLAEFEDFCSKHAQEQTPIDFDNLLVYLRDISGLVLYYPNIASLRDTVFINPNWVCTQIYRILDYSVQNSKGEFTFAHAEQKLGSNANAQQFIALMQQFELIFEKQDEPQTYIAPQYLPKTSDKRDKFIGRWQYKLAFKARYANYMPPHFIVRLIARYGAYAIQNLYWKQGLAFTHPEFAKIALIEAQTEPDEIALYVSKDDNSTELIQEVFAQLLKLDDQQNFELILEDGTGVEWKKLKREYDPDADIFTNNGHFPCQRFAIFMPPTPHQKSPNNMAKKLNVFISYSHKEENFKEALDTHLISLKRSNTIATWDSSVLAGSNLNTAIQKLDNAHIIIILTSANYVADDDLWKEHLQRAMNRHDNNKARVIPIKVRDFNSTGLPFDKIQGLPRNGQAIGSPSNDTVLAEVAEEIRAVVTAMLKEGIGVDEQSKKSKEPEIPPPPKPDTVKKVLFVCASPKDIDLKLDFGEEFRKINDALNTSLNRTKFEITIKTGVKFDELPRLLMNTKPDILHISMHSSLQRRGLLFEHNDGTTQALSPSNFKDMVRNSIGKALELIVLSACNSKNHAKELVDQARHIIGMNDFISDEAAAYYAGKFYEIYFDHEDVSKAHNIAITNLRANSRIRDHEMFSEVPYIQNEINQL